MSAVFELVGPGPRPPFVKVAHHLWGRNCDFDSDGDSHDPQSRQWTELTVILRDETGGWLSIGGVVQRVDIDPVSIEPLILRVTSEDKNLSRSTAEFLHDSCGGTLRSTFEE